MQLMEVSMKHHIITGGGGTQLHVVETGSSAGRPILFIHGFSQSCFSWNRQLNSDLADDFRLIAMDIRGHGRSEKPRDAYGDSQLWADDIKAVIDDLGLDRPILVGWSYGPLILLDYVRHHGESSIAGVNFVCGITRLGSDEAMAVLTPAFLEHVPGLFSTDVNESVQSLESLVRLCLTPEPADEDIYLMLGWNVTTPPYVRQAMFSRTFDNDDLLPNIGVPVLVTHGTDDRIVKSLAAEQIKAAVPHAQLHLMQNAGHAPFWDSAPTYNARLREFAGGKTAAQSAGEIV